MPVQVWIGEKPEHPQERRAIVGLAQALERLEGLHLILANFSVSGRAVDLVVIKHDAMVIIELKNVDGRVFGNVNGPWTVIGSNGEEKRLNPGRKNPYNQVLSYFHALTNFLNENRRQFLSDQKAGSLDFRTCKRLVVIAPSIQPGSQIELDWKVDLKGLDELPTYLITERSSEIELSEQEMLAIPRLLNCEPWQEVDAVIARPPATPEPRPAAVTAGGGGRALVRAALEPAVLRFVLAIGAAAALGLLLLLLIQPGRLAGIDSPAALPLLPTAAGGLAVATETPPCGWHQPQLIARRWDSAQQAWFSVAAGAAASGENADLVLALADVDACSGQLVLRWNIQNNSAQDLTFTITPATLDVSDGLGNRYTFADAELPGELTVAAGGQAGLTTAATRNLALNAGTLLIVLRDQPFGEASFLIALTQ